MTVLVMPMELLVFTTVVLAEDRITVVEEMFATIFMYVQEGLVFILLQEAQKYINRAVQTCVQAERMRVRLVISAIADAAVDVEGAIMIYIFAEE